MTHLSEANIVNRVVRQAEYLEDVDDWDQIDALDVNYTVNDRSGVTGVELLVAFGGPTIRVNALSGTVSGSWGGDTHTTHFDSDVVEEYGRMLARQFEEGHDL